MPDKPSVDTEDLVDTKYDATRFDRAEPASDVPSGIKEPAPSLSSGTGEAPEVGLAQKGTDEAAIVRRETEI